MRSHRGPGRKPLEHHGESTWADNTPEYAAWVRMVRRCENPRHRAYPFYGGRGISVCDRWRMSYRLFLEDMGRRPSPGHSLDRVDVDRNYEPGNVRWATKVEQMRNMRSNRWVTVRGERMTLAEAIERHSVVSRKAVEARLKSGWDEERAICAPMQPQGMRGKDPRRCLTGGA